MYMVEYFLIEPGKLVSRFFIKFRFRVYPCTTSEIQETYCNCRSKLVSQLTNGQLNSKCDDTKAYVDLYRFIKKTGQSASHNSLWQ